MLIHICFIDSIQIAMECFTKNYCKLSKEWKDAPHVRRRQGSSTVKGSIL